MGSRKQGARTFFAGEVDRFNIGNELCCFYSKQSSQTVVVNAAIAGLIQHWQTRCRLEIEPAANGRVAIPDALAQLYERGFLTPEQTFRTNLARAARRAKPPPRIETLAIVTANRASYLKRAVVSYAAHLATHGRARAVTVFNDTRDRASLRSQRKMLERIAREHGIDVRYAAAEEKRAFARRLQKRSGVPAHVIDFALFGDADGGTFGANRNAFLLDTVGVLALSADDDTSAEIMTAPRATDELTIRWSHAIDVWLHDERRPSSDSIVEAHEKLLGWNASLRSTVASPIATSFLEIDARSAALLQSGAGHAVLTMSGVHGTPCFGDIDPYLALRGASRMRLVQSPAVYKRTMRGDPVLIGYERWGLEGPNPTFTTALSGFDNRELMPPFVPVGRGEDTLFSEMVGACVPGAMVGLVPRMVSHERPIHPSFARFETRFARPSQCAILVDVIRRFRGHGPVDARLAQLARHLADVASVSKDSFRQRVHTIHLDTLARRIDWHHHRLNQFGRHPDYWVRDIERQIAAYRRSLDVVSNDDKRNAFASEVQSRIARFAELVSAWPTIVASARELRESGEGLTRAITA